LQRKSEGANGPRNDGDAVYWIRVFDRECDESVAGFVIGDRFGEERFPCTWRADQQHTSGESVRQAVDTSPVL